MGGGLRRRLRRTLPRTRNNGAEGENGTERRITRELSPPPRRAVLRRTAHGSLLLVQLCLSGAERLDVLVVFAAVGHRHRKEQDQEEDAREQQDQMKLL